MFLITVTPATFGLKNALLNFLMRNCANGVVTVYQKHPEKNIMCTRYFDFKDVYLNLF